MNVKPGFRGRPGRFGAGVAAAALVGLALLAGGCKTEEACTDVGCSDGFVLTLLPEGDRFPVGSYKVRMTPTVGPMEECGFEILDDPDDCPAGPCVGDQDCNAIYVVGVFSTDRVLISYPVLEGPLLVDVLVDNSPRASFQVDADYTTHRPNGENCPPECLQADAQIEVPDS